MKPLNKNIYKRYIKCPECKNVMELWSKKRYVRPKGHIKTMTRYYCGNTVDGIEIGDKYGKP